MGRLPLALALLWLAMVAPATFAGQNSLAETEEAALEGQALFNQLCASCHGFEGKGDGEIAHEVLLRPRSFLANAFKFDTNADWERGTDSDLADVIRFGPSTYGGSPLMPAWSALSDDDVASLIAYIRYLQR